MPPLSPSEQLTRYMHVHYNVLFDYGLKLTDHNHDLTKDCIQEVFAAFWQCRAEWGTIQSVKAYLLVALRNRITDAHRAGQRFVPLLSFPDTDESETAVSFAFTVSDAGAPDDGLPAQRLTTALDRLPRRQREAIFLRYYQEMDYADVASVMGVKERTVYNLVHEGLTQLRQHLNPARWILLGVLSAGILFFLKIF